MSELLQVQITSYLVVLDSDNCIAVSVSYIKSKIKRSLKLVHETGSRPTLYMMVSFYNRIGAMSDIRSVRIFSRSE